MEKTQIRGADRLWSWITTGLWMRLWQRFLAPKVPVKSIPYSLRYSLGRASAGEGTCPAHCSLHMKITIILSSATLLQLIQWKEMVWVQTMLAVTLYQWPNCFSAQGKSWGLWVQGSHCSLAKKQLAIPNPEGMKASNGGKLSTG